jgi:hypothetical protein
MGAACSCDENAPKDELTQLEVNPKKTELKTYENRHSGKNVFITDL